MKKHYILKVPTIKIEAYKRKALWDKIKRFFKKINIIARKKIRQ